ncbi:hypothetical protein BPTFM16_00113 [Altererythrobacter insulae]|nr:hypothetical protein BPTFM16_00113 [Altererythrobacter insulae]
MIVAWVLGSPALAAQHGNNPEDNKQAAFNNTKAFDPSDLSDWSTDPVPDWRNWRSRDVFDLLEPILKAHPETDEGRPTVEVSVSRYIERGHIETDQAGDPQSFIGAQITRRGFLDDAVSGDRYFAQLSYLDGSWSISKLWGQQLCARGPSAGIWKADGCGQSTPASLCKAHEQSVFNGSVHDDFGIGISVCQSKQMGTNQVVSVRSQGEGGTSVVSCNVGECEGVIGLKRYTRPRFTILTFEWLDQGSYNKIVETHDAQCDTKAPTRIAKNYWASEDMLSSKIDPIENPMSVFSDPLSLMALSGLLPHGVRSND